MSTSKKDDKEVAVIDATPEPEETPNLPVSIQEQIAKELAEQKKYLGALPSNKIATKGKKFTLPDGQSSAGPFEAIILDYTWFLVHYPGVFNPNSPQQPDCYAIGREKPDGGELKPDEEVENPYGENCRDCPKNQWKSDPQGNGKACKNQRRLILVPPNFTEESDPMTLYVSPGALKNFDAYVSRLASEHGILPVQAITEISFDPTQTYPSLMFKFVRKHDNMQLAWALRDRGQEVLFRKLETKESSDGEKAA